MKTSMRVCLLAVVGGAALTPMARAQDGDGVADDRVVVTALKREQGLQDVSLAVTAVTPSDLLESQVNTLEDLQVLVPGLTVGNDFAFAKVFVRGIGLNSAFAGIDPSVALHVDGAVVSQAAAHFTSLYDLERVEVLRGPQGTLYGRNATGGSINLITAKPTDAFEGYGRLSLGNYNQVLAEGAVSGPIGQRLFGRIAARTEHRDGFGVHTGSGQDIDNADKFGVRGQLRFVVSERVNTLLSIEYYDEDENSRAFKFVRASFPETTNPGLVAVGLPDVTANSRDAGGDFVPLGQLQTTSVTNTLTYDITDWLSLKSVTNWRDTSSLLLQDFDISDTVNGDFPPAPTSTTQLQRVDSQQFSEELQLLVTRDRWRGIFGAYVFRDDVVSRVLIGRDPLANQTTIERNRVIVDAWMDVVSYAAFANVTVDLTDSASIRLGARYSEESRDVESLFGVASPTATEPVFDPLNVTSRDYSDFTPEIGLDYRFSDGTLLYFTYSEGFKSGTANLGERTPSLVAPETIENYEVGLKGSYFGDTLQLNLAGFVYQVEDAQFDRPFPIPAPPFFTVRLENAAATDGQGLELEAMWQPVPALTIDASATLYDIEFEEFLSLDPLNEALFGADSTTVEPVDLAGNSPRNTPEWSFAVRGAYAIDLDGGGVVTPAIAYAAKGEQFYTEFNNPVLGADAYGILDANVAYTSPDGRLTVNLWGKNLTDEFVLSGAFAISTSRTIAGTYLAPRQYGATIGYRF